MKTKEQLLNQVYLSTSDLKQLLGVGEKRARDFMHEIQEEMVEKNYKLPNNKNLMVLTKLVRKKFGI